MGNLLCMGLPSCFISAPAPLDVSDNGLPAFVDVNVFNSHFLLAFPPIAVEGFHLGCEGSR